MAPVLNSKYATGYAACSVSVFLYNRDPPFREIIIIIIIIIHTFLYRHKVVTSEEVNNMIGE